MQKTKKTLASASAARYVKATAWPEERTFRMLKTVWYEVANNPNEEDEEEELDIPNATQLRRHLKRLARQPPLRHRQCSDTQNREPGNLSSAVCNAFLPVPYFRRAIFLFKRYPHTVPPHPTATMLAHAHSAESFI